jgi:hypothetical protein
VNVPFGLWIVGGGPGGRTLKYAAWGDGYELSTVSQHDDGGFTALYGASGKIVGVLTHHADEDYEQGEKRIGQGAPWES